MATDRLSSKDRERFARARARGHARVSDPSAIERAHYDPKDDGIYLRFRKGGSMLIPRRVVPGLEGHSVSTLALVELSPAGDALSWPTLDVDVFIPGLVERAFGARLFAAATGRRGGRRRSKAKTAAAKLNGTKGGRPRKRASV